MGQREASHPRAYLHGAYRTLCEQGASAPKTGAQNNLRTTSWIRNLICALKISD
jgi:hypothetical protein